MNTPHARIPITSFAIALFATVVLLVLNASQLHAQSDTPRGMARVTWPRALRDLKRGDIVRAEDYVLADTTIVWRIASAVPDTTRAITGWVARRVISAGEFLRAPSVAPASVITLGSPVKVIWDDGVVRLMLSGTATNNAAMGAPVGVRIDKNRRLDGIAVGLNTVRLR